MIATAAADAETSSELTASAAQSAILSQLAEGVIVTDVNGRIVLVNEAAAIIHGVARLDVEPDAYSETYHLYTEGGMPYAPRELPLARAVRGETVVDARWRIRRPDGTEILAIGTAQPLRDPTGRRIGAVLTLRDDTGRDAAERALRELAATLTERVAARTREAETAREAAEAASRAKSDFLAAMSHEIRTPLNGVLGYADLLLDEAALTLDARLSVERIRSAGAALLTIVNDILDFSKVEAGQIELVPRPFSPEALADEAIAIVRVNAERKNLHVAVDLDPRLPARVIGDDDRLRQVLLNLLNNAIKFTQAGSVRLTVTMQSSPLGRARLRFEVRDSGVGIPADKHHLLFERFSQVDGSVQREFGGTGLGLAISRRLVDLMDGDIGVDSRVGRGSTFWFEVALPIAAAPPATTRTAAARAPTTPRRVLVVEDVELNQDLVRAILERDGHEVDVVPGGAEAVAAVQAQAYDLVLMDIQMPGVDGLTATRRIRALDGPAAQVPIVAMTANVLAHQVAEYRAAGMQDCVGKPFQRQALFTAIERWAQSSQPMTDREARAPENRDDGFDRTTFQSIAEVLGPTLMDQMLGGLASELETRLGADGTVLDPTQIAFDAHALVSGLGSLGFTSMASACREMAHACRDGEDHADDVARLHDMRRTTLDLIGRLRATTADAV